ncbi:hypothetical protein EDD22DRAFT_927579 [Suillus occidentalis]|nr:hypothetical protein EDD22DRAFT_927579 [Suillus occidentalis]
MPMLKDNNLRLFIVTTNSVNLYHVSRKGSGGFSVLLEVIGCGLGCAAMDWRVEKIYAYDVQGRELPYASCHMLMKLTRIADKYTSEKLSMLYAKALYPLALSLAQTQHFDESYVADIHRQYGDYFHVKEIGMAQ